MTGCSRICPTVPDTPARSRSSNRSTSSSSSRSAAPGPSVTAASSRRTGSATTEAPATRLGGDSLSSTSGGETCGGRSATCGRACLSFDRSDDGGLRAPTLPTNAACTQQAPPSVWTGPCGDLVATPLVLTRSADDLLEGRSERPRLLGVELDDQAPASFERDPHHDAAALLGHLERTVARPRLHRGHAHTSFWVSSARRPVPGARSTPDIIAHCGCSLAVTLPPRCGRLDSMHARSALFDLYGDHLRSRGDRAPVASLVRLLAPLGVTAAAVRTAISRMVRQGWLDPERLAEGPGYALT